MNTEQLLETNMLCKLLSGSHAYGTALPTSDIDYRGLFYAPKEVIRTPYFPLNEISDGREEDTKFYELTRFFQLFTNANPNIIELAFVDRDCIEATSDPYEYIRKHAGQLLSSKVAFTFSGYACAQLKRLKGHKKWINNPQPEDPYKQSSFLTLVRHMDPNKMVDCGISESYLAEDHELVSFSNNFFGIMKSPGSSLFNADHSLKIVHKPSHETNAAELVAIAKFCKEEYEKAHGDWKNYWTWKKNRNQARGELEELHGYDTKAAMHLVRLMNMGREILQTGEVKVKRPDAQMLLDVRAGKWTYEELIDFATSSDEDIRNNLYKTTALPKTPDIHLAASMLMDLQDMCWSNQAQLRVI